MSIHYDSSKGAYRYAFNRKINGKKVRATKLLPKGWTREEADAYDVRQSKELYTQYSTGAHLRPKIEDAVLLYLKEHCHALKTYQEYVDEYERLLPLYEGKYFEDLPDVCIAIQQLNAFTGHEFKKERPLSPASKRKKIRMLSAACNWAFKYKNMGDYKPSERVQIPKVRNQRTQYPTRAEMLRLARFTSNKAARCLIICAFYSGMREGELERADVDDGLFKLYDTKNSSIRFVPINPKLNVYLKRFPYPCTYSTLRYWMDKGRKSLGLMHYRFHDLRHSTASEMINQGEELYTVGKVLGHKSVVSTSIYTHLLVDTMKRALDKVGKRK